MTKEKWIEHIVQSTGEKSKAAVIRHRAECPDCPECIKWHTDDTCPNCGNDGMTFILEEHKGIEWFGYLVCGKCGEGEDAICYAYQVPEEMK